MTDSKSITRKLGRSGLLAGLAVAALMAAAPAQAQTSYPVNIPAGPLDGALLSLAKQTHQQLFFSKALVAGHNVAALKGRFTSDQALAVLLAATDISMSRAGPELVVLRRAPSVTPAKIALPEVEGASPFVTAAQGAKLAETAAQGSEPPTTRPKTNEPPPATTVEEVEVTGSHIRGGTSASPLVVVSHADIERSGQTTLAEALKALPQNFGGAAADGNSTTGADRVGHNTVFGTGLNLRGLGNNATLILVNGRRVAGSGAYGDFTDVSTIPTAAVDRVEVLLDGASAIYGSDAVGGVVNIILKKTYEGAETRILVGSGAAGEPHEGQISQTFGHRWDGGGVLFSYEAQQRDALPSSARSFTASADLRPHGGSDQRLINSFPGNILATNPVTGATSPAFAIPAGQNGVGLTPSALQAGVINHFNQRTGLDVLPLQISQTAYLAIDQSLGDRLDLSADARYGFRRYHLQLADPATTLTVTRANPFFVAPNGAASESIAYELADLPNPTQTGSAETLSLTGGGTLKLGGDWRLDGYLAFGQEIDEGRSSGNLRSSALNEALGTTADNPATPFSTAKDGFYNPFAGVLGANSAAALTYIGSGFTYIRSDDRVYSASLQADGTLWTLPAGPLKLAVGVQGRRETFIRGGSNFVSGLTPTPAAAVDVARNVTAAFAELQAPLFGPDNARPGLQRLELSLAGRVESYQAIGVTSNPKVGLLWEPVQDLHVRATYGTSFRAPALREIYDAPSFAPTLLALAGTQVRSLLLSGGNPDLQPETATSWTTGFDVSPHQIPGLTLSATWFDIHFHNRIDRPVTQNILNALSDPNLASFVNRISPLTNAADLARITALVNNPATSTLVGVFPPTAYGAIVDNRYVNTTTLVVRGLDGQATYAFDVGQDRVILGANATYMFDYDQQVTPTAQIVNLAGVANFPVKFRARATADWTRGQLTYGAALNYVGAYHDALGVPIAAQPTVDLQVRLAPRTAGPWRGISALLNVRNVFDRAPPFYNNAAGVGYDPANADPIGRYVSLQLIRSW